MYKILCRVSGGVTGYRCAYLKENDTEMVFDSYEVAKAEADKLTESMNSGASRYGARFSYVPEAC